MKNFIEIREFLTGNFGLSDKEVELYLFLIKNGASTVLEISEATGIKRSTVHLNLEYLSQKELIKQVYKGQGSRRILFAESPEKLNLLLKQHKAKLSLVEKKLPSIIKDLSNIVDKDKIPDLEIRYYRGKNEVRFIYQRALLANEFRAYLNCKKLASGYPNNPKKFTEALKKRESMKMWEIIEDSPEAKEYAKNMPKNRYYYKIAPKEANLAIVDYMLFDNQVAIVDFRQEITGVIVEDENFYKNNKAIFEFVWQFLPSHEN